LSPIAQAAYEPRTNDWYLAPFGTFVYTDDARGPENAWGAGAGIGKVLNEHFNVEVRGFYNAYKGTAVGQTNANTQMEGGTADVQYFFNRDRFSPYAVLGAGVVNTTSLFDNDALGIVAETGLGFTYELMDHLLFRSDVRYRYNNNFNNNLGRSSDDFHDMTVNVGFVIPLGAKIKAAEPAPAPAPARIADCSTMDSDADGVNNCLDKCAGTLAGSQVDENGCPIRLELKGVHFKYDSAELTSEAQTILDNVAESFIAYPQDKDIEVQGHTSSEGSDNYNLRLSKARAHSVVDYLKARGVKNKLYAKGYGESSPVAENDSEVGRARNRRVELIWIGE
jgi:OOP family OmpA-OmpF porin